MSEYKLQYDEQELEDSEDIIEIEYLEPGEDLKERIPYKLSKKEVLVIDIYHKQKAKKAALQAKDDALIRYSLYLLK